MHQALNRTTITNDIQEMEIRMQPPPQPSNFEIDDLLGYSISDIECDLCAGALCGSRAIRIIEDEVIAICGKSQAGRDILRGYRYPAENQQD